MCIYILSHSAKNSLASRSCSAHSRLYYLLVSSALCSPWFSPERAYPQYMQYSYSGTLALRHFVIHSVRDRYPYIKLCLQLSSAPRVRRELYSTTSTCFYIQLELIFLHFLQFLGTPISTLASCERNSMTNSTTLDRLRHRIRNI